jgi:hypothetical protein
MTGPGHVTLQTLPFSRTARRVLEAAHGGGDERGGFKKTATFKIVLQTNGRTTTETRRVVVNVH